MNAKTFFLVLLLVGLVGYGGYYWGTKNKTPQVKEVEQKPSVTATISVTPKPTVDEKEALKAAMKKDLAKKHGGSGDIYNVTVSAIDRVYAKGGVTETGAVGGAMWFAVKTNGAWGLVWDGNGTISCELIDTYPEFPKTMIPECWNETTGKNVVR